MISFCRDEEDQSRCYDEFLSYIGQWGVPTQQGLESYESGMISNLCTLLHPTTEKDWSANRFNCFNNTLEDSSFASFKKALDDCKKWKVYADYKEQGQAASCYETQLMKLHQGWHGYQFRIMRDGACPSKATSHESQSGHFAKPGIEVADRNRVRSSATVQQKSSNAAQGN